MPSISASVPDHLESFDTSDMNETYSDESDHDNDQAGRPSSKPKKLEKRLPPPPRIPTDPNLSTKAKSVVSNIPASKGQVSDKQDRDSALVDEYGFLWESKKDMPPPV
jgi:hypothetical protein